MMSATANKKTRMLSALADLDMVCTSSTMLSRDIFSNRNTRASLVTLNTDRPGMSTPLAIRSSQ